MNNFHAVGRIAAEIKLQKNEKGVVYTRFPLAISRGNNKDGENRGNDFPMITVFEKQAENLQKCSGKGKRVAIEAHIQTSKYEKDDKTRYSTSIIADRIEYLDWKDQNDNVDAADDNYYDDCSFSGYEYEDEGDIL